MRMASCTADFRGPRTVPKEPGFLETCENIRASQTGSHSHQWPGELKGGGGSNSFCDSGTKISRAKLEEEAAGSWYEKG